MIIPTETIAWLLSGPPWVAYRTRRDLLNEPENDPQVQAAREQMVAHPQVQGLIGDLATWPAPVLKSHKTAHHPLHKLALLADFGLCSQDPGLPGVINRILERQATQGPFHVLMNISPAYGGSGKDDLAWMLCDAPLVAYSLARLGLQEDARLQQAIEYLVNLSQDNGWPCAVSPEMGKWRGPGKKEDPCPYANLAMLKLLAHIPEYQESRVARAGAETLLTLWSQSLERHPYLFYMGTDFRKLKAPLIWYDILHVVDTLTQFPWLFNDSRLQEMVGVIRSKADAQSRFTPESVWKAYEAWDFGQKKEPSRWLTLLALRALERVS
jgi:hypothetical protein